MISIPNPEWNPWENDQNTFHLYRKRCRQETVEMTCAAQAAEILKSKIKQGESLLDAGCGGGYYFWSFFNRSIPVKYYGMDFTQKMIELARKEICKKAKIPENRFILNSIEHLDKEYDNILCFNVLTNSPHYALPLEQLLKKTKKKLLLRESLSDSLIIRYTPDPYLDPGKRHIRVYHNTYPLTEVVSFISECGFRTEIINDKRTKNRMEMVVDIPHYWKIILAERI